MADSYVPTGPDGIAVKKLRTMVSQSAAFQARSALGESALYDLCCLTINETLDNKPPPFYVIIVAESAQNWYAGGGQNFLLPAGRLGLLLECEPASGQTTNNDKRHESYDFFGNVMNEIAALAAADDPGEASSHLDIRNMRIADFWETPPLTQGSSGVSYGCLISVDWGNPGGM